MSRPLVLGSGQRLRGVIGRDRAWKRTVRLELADAFSLHGRLDEHGLHGREGAVARVHLGCAGGGEGDGGCRGRRRRRNGQCDLNRRTGTSVALPAQPRAHLGRRTRSL
jgi:hypothetical protein